MSLKSFTIDHNATLHQVLKVIDANLQGAVFVVDANQSVVGVLTDGDIRRQLIAGKSMQSTASECLNAQFVWANESESREAILKKLDSHIRLIPVLNNARQLVDVITREHFPLSKELPVFARSRAPVRISFGGGGSDLTHYFSDNNAAVINATIAIYSHAALRKRADSRIVIRSADLGATLEADDLAQATQNAGDFALILSVVKLIAPSFGFELSLHSDFPVGSGLGGSATLCTAILGCFNEFRQDKWDSHEIAELAYQAERLYLGVDGGWQDQYASAFGGFNFIEFRMDQNVVHPLRIKPETLLELESNLLLCDSGQVRNSGSIHADQREQMSQDAVQQRVRDNVELTYRMRNHLLRSHLTDFALCLNEAWQLKRGFSQRISSDDIDALYQCAMQAGALGGKLLGAGGGGFMLFYVPAFKRVQVVDALQRLGKHVRPLKFEPDGVQSWSVRQEDES